MKKIYKNFLVIFFIVFFICLAVLLSWPTGRAVAQTLEVQYPTLKSGVAVTAQSDFAEYLKYIFYAGMFMGVVIAFLSLVWGGVLYFLSPAIPNALADAKDRVTGAISGLLILALLYLIITTINPYLAIFKLQKVNSPTIEPPSTAQAGVNFYNSQDCSDNSNANTTSISSFGSLKNKINSVSIVNNTDASYISILYDIDNYWGKCQYINPNSKCQTVSPFAASASIYPYDFNSSGDGVYLYRNSFYNKQGGWYKINGSKLNKIYIEALDNLRFFDQSAVSGDNSEGCTVPKEERDCATWNAKGECTKWSCPTLGGKNVSSIKISGNYLVLLVYFSPTDKSYGPWTYCQAFPTINDVNKDGPQQIKWDAIRSRGQDPNYIVIIPILEK